ncbi:MAG: carbohydrate ABC transporter permease [Clostridiaceae bacterium]|nr:carbohydrate ABC transporter permease [Clostridiaceae bacterium]
MSKNKFGNYSISIILAIIAAVQIFPLIWLIFFSLKSDAEIFGENIIGLPQKFLWQNYSKALVGGNAGMYFLNSVFVTGVTIILSGVLSSMAAYAIVRMKWKLRKPVLTIFLLGMMIPIHAALLPLFLILKNLNLYDSPLALIVPYTAFALPMSIFILTSFLQSIPKELEEAALIDGCNIYQAFFSIIVPVLKPALATISIFTYLSTWNELMFAVTFISKREYKTLTVGIMSMVGQYSTNWGPIGAGLVIATLPTIIIYILMSSQVQKSLTSGAVKG